jgi:hypothetical protein
VDVAHGEWVEMEPTSFIGKRDRQRRRAKGERRLEEAWMESERRYIEKRRRTNRALSFAHFCQMAASHARRATSKGGRGIHR